MITKFESLSKKPPNKLPLKKMPNKLPTKKDPQFQKIPPNKILNKSLPLKKQFKSLPFKKLPPNKLPPRKMPSLNNVSDKSKKKIIFFSYKFTDE